MKHHNFGCVENKQILFTGVEIGKKYAVILKELD